MINIKNFKKWAKKESHGKRLVCHFYIKEGKKQYYDNSDYAYFNLFNKSKGWVVKGTPGHGIKSRMGKQSKVPCLNCFEVDDEFYKALKDVGRYGNSRFELGIILNKRKLKSLWKVIDVSIKRPQNMPRPNMCHYYDNPRFRSGTLNPFNYCNVVRIEINKKILGQPIAELPRTMIKGLIVKRGTKLVVRKLLTKKCFENVKIFPIL